jgi:hypothetical protein
MSTGLCDDSAKCRRLHKLLVDPGKGASGIEAYVLDTDALLAFIADDGVPDSHIAGGKAQLVRAGQRVVTRKRGGRRDYLVMYSGQPYLCWRAVRRSRHALSSRQAPISTATTPHAPK